MNNSEILLKVANTICPDGPNVPATRILLRNDVVSLADNDLQQDDRLFVYKQENGSSTLEEVMPMTAEEFCAFEGYTSVRLITLLDIERKLEAAGKTAPKLTSVRRWIDAVLMQFALNPAPKLEWDECPYTFEETLQEAISIINI